MIGTDRGRPVLLLGLWHGRAAWLGRHSGEQGGAGTDPEWRGLARSWHRRGQPWEVTDGRKRERGWPIGDDGAWGLGAGGGELMEMVTGREGRANPPERVVPEGVDGDEVDDGLDTEEEGARRREAASWNQWRPDGRRKVGRVGSESWEQADSRVEVDHGGRHGFGGADRGFEKMGTWSRAGWGSTEAGRRWSMVGRPEVVTVMGDWPWRTEKGG